MDQQCAIIFVNLFVWEVIVQPGLCSMLYPGCIRFLMFDFGSGHYMHELGRKY